MPLESKLLVCTVKLKHQVFLTALVFWGTGPHSVGLEFVQKWKGDPDLLSKNAFMASQYFICKYDIQCLMLTLTLKVLPIFNFEILKQIWFC